MLPIQRQQERETLRERRQCRAECGKRQARQVKTGVTGVEHIGGKHGVKARVAVMDSLCRKRLIKAFCIMANGMDARFFQHGAQHRLVFRCQQVFAVKQNEFAVLTANGNLRRECGNVTFSQHQFPCGFRLFGGRFLCLIQPHALDHGRKLKFRKKAGQCRSVGTVISACGKIILQRHLPADSSKRAGEVGAFFSVFQFGAHGGGQVCRGQVVIDTIQTPVFGNQFQRGFLSDPRHAGDIIGTIPHQGFHVHENRGVYPVFFAETRRGKVNRFGIGGKQDVHPVGDQLQRVTVAGQKICFRVFLLCQPGESAENVIRFIPLFFHAGKAQRRRGLFCQRKLGGKFLRHGSAPGFVFRIYFMPERRGFEVKCDGGKIRLYRGKIFFQNIDHTKQGVGGQPLFGRKRTHSVKRPVDNTVAVNGK